MGFVVKNFQHVALDSVVRVYKRDVFALGLWDTKISGHTCSEVMVGV